MRPRQAKAALNRFAKANGINIKKSSPEQGFRQMFEFFKAVKLAGFERDDDGDMLLFQWGTYERDGRLVFLIDLTRQFYEVKLGEYVGTSQLAIAYYFEATPSSDLIGHGDRWLSGGDDVDEFVEFVMKSEAFLLAGEREVEKVEFGFWYI